MLIFVSLFVGVGGGLMMGFSQRGDGDAGSLGAESVDQRQISRLVAEARSAVAEGDWIEARRIFEEVRDIDPDNPDALASLPLIDRHLDEARGTLEVVTNPAGALVTLVGIGERISPATFAGIPFGEREVRISLEGYEPLLRKIQIESERLLELKDIELTRSSGHLEVVSEPEGADFKLLKTLDKEAPELVEIGKTPARIELLDPGEYQVLMAVEGWPEYSEYVRVENNRNSSVSAVFAKGSLNITSDPAGAEVWTETEGGNFKKRGVTPLSLPDLPVGKHKLELRFGSWSPIARTVEVVDGKTQDLAFSWERTLVAFGSDPAGATVFLGDKRLGDGRQVTPFRMELPEGDYVFTARHDQLGSVSKSVYLDSAAGTNEVRFPFEYGSVTLDSTPPGAAVVSNGVPIGRTPLTLSVVPPGRYTYELSKEQHRGTTVSGTLDPGGALNFMATLKYDPAPVTSRNFKNGLGEDLVWFGSLNGWVAAHETTQANFERITGENPSYFKAPNHPVDSVTWYQAVKYCEALTLLERGLGNIPDGYRYRLPTDKEWGTYVGQQKLDGAISSLFDRQKSTAPVGSLAPNEYGLYDVRGNVWEWVTDWYSQTIVNRMQQEGASPNPEWVGTDRKVLRGGAWNRSSQYDLAVENRMASSPAAEDRYDVGFRVLLMPD